MKNYIILLILIITIINGEQISIKRTTPALKNDIVESESVDYKEWETTRALESIDSSRQVEELETAPDTLENEEDSFIQVEDKIAFLPAMITLLPALFTAKDEIIAWKEFTETKVNNELQRSTTVTISNHLSDVYFTLSLIYEPLGGKLINADPVIPSRSVGKFVLVGDVLWGGYVGFMVSIDGFTKKDEKKKTFLHLNVMNSDEGHFKIDGKKKHKSPGWKTFTKNIDGYGKIDIYVTVNDQKSGTVNIEILNSINVESDELNFLQLGPEKNILKKFVPKTLSTSKSIRKWLQRGQQLIQNEKARYSKVVESIVVNTHIKNMFKDVLLEVTAVSHKPRDRWGVSIEAIDPLIVPKSTGDFIFRGTHAIFKSRKEKASPKLHLRFTIKFLNGKNAGKVVRVTVYENYRHHMGLLREPDEAKVRSLFIQCHSDNKRWGSDFALEAHDKAIVREATKCTELDIKIFTAWIPNGKITTLSLLIGHKKDFFAD